MSRNVGRGENPFRERNPANAQRREELMRSSRSRLDAMQAVLDKRAEAMRLKRKEQE